MEEEKYYYIYEWYNVETNEVFYVGKGCRGRSGQITRRNQKFKDYYNTHKCDVRRVEYFDDEAEALKREHEIILEYKSKNQAIANLDDGGKGGCHFVWTDEMRKYQSEYNPMKEEKQRIRMSENNPMKNPEVVAKVMEKKRKPVIIDNVRYASVLQAATQLHHAEQTIISWCRKGYSQDGKICRYEEDLNKTFPPFEEATALSYEIGVFVDDKYYTNLKQAATENNISYSYFSKKLKEKNGYAIIKNHICKYANQQPSQENNQ